MRKIRKYIPYLLFGFISSGIFITTILNIPPNSSIEIIFLGINSNYIFLTSLTLFIFGLSSFVLRDIRRGLFIGSFIGIYLILRILNLTHFYFFIILALFFISLDLFFAYGE